MNFTTTIEIAHPPERVFALLAEVARTPEWLSRCTAIEQLDPGAPKAGTQLRFTFQQGKRSGAMVGSITAFEPAHRIAFAYGDKLFATTVEFALTATATGTRLVENLQITTHTLAGKLLQPLIRGILAKALGKDLEKLRGLV